MVHLPVGLSMAVGKHGRLDAELGVHLDPEAMGSLVAPLANMRDEVYNGFDLYQYMPYIGVGYAIPLGAKK